MKIIGSVFLIMLLASFSAAAAEYRIDDRGAHASINFKIKHLGYSWLTGRFNTFSGTFNYDAENPNAASIKVDIDVTSIDSNHAERDKHLRGSDFLNVDKFPKANFNSTKITDKGNGKIEVVGELTLHGVTKSITIDAEKIGEGKDPWGGYRAGFAGETKIRLKDFGMQERLGPASTEVYLDLHVEGIRK
ncbi:YceI family protein [Aliikangiella marina]|uniref:YceI family protein n=1 Tax=Aliikangiella marina TaxID=1712262 RepID=A0A545T473_9GAMM|nr:YceI family protein [Aliikangiella marina]TQV72019.1 YceI family protein [Aliikangiella marina]TQV72072.1 YceI family protein [Aliikangiella marina]